jgi:hypothetical protein
MSEAGFCFRKVSGQLKVGGGQVRFFACTGRIRLNDVDDVPEVSMKSCEYSD